MDNEKLKMILLIASIISLMLGIIIGVLALVFGLLYMAIALILIAICIVTGIYTIRIEKGEDDSHDTTSAIRVVAIDDEADILRLIRIKLSKEGFEVSTASNGEEGIAKVLKEKPEIMVVDVMMPGKDGYEVVAEVKKKLGENAPVTIMLTSKAEEGDMVKGLSVGADDYITKPFSPRELIERINVALIKGTKDRE